MANEQEARVELTADTRSFQQKLTEARKQWGLFGRGLAKGGKNFGKEMSKVFGGIGKKALGFGTTALGIGAVGGLAAVAGNEARKTVEFEEGLTRLKIASRGALGNLDAFRSKVFAVSTATGLAREEVLRGAAAYLTLTGDAKSAIGQVEMFAKVQRATGSSMEDLAGAAAALAQNLKIDPSQFEKAFSILIAGGKAGSVELKDMAGLLATLAPLAEQFSGGAGVGGLANLGAALQLTRQGFGSASEAATGLESLMGAIVKNAGRLEGAGIKVFDKDAKTGQKTMRNFQEIVEAIGTSKLAKDPTKLIKALGRKEAYSAYLQLVKVKGAWDDLTGATLKANDAVEDYAEFQESTAGKLQVAWTNVQNSLAATFTPERLDRFARMLERVVDLADKLLRTFEKYSEFVKGPQGEEKERRIQEELDAFEGESDAELEYRAATGDQQRGQILKERRSRKMARERFDRETDTIGAPMVGVPQSFDTEADAKTEEEALDAGVIVHDPSSPEVRRRRPIEARSREVNVRVEPVKVKVSAGPGLKAEVDNDPRQRVSP